MSYWITAARTLAFAVSKFCRSSARCRHAVRRSSGTWSVVATAAIAAISKAWAMGMATTGDAILLGILSRAWLTVLEILPGLVSLLLLYVFAASRDMLGLSVPWSLAATAAFVP